MARADVRYSVHQDVLARRCRPSHAGTHRCPARSTGCAVCLGGRGGVRAAGPASPGSSEVIAVATRRWRRKALEPTTWREMAGFLRMLRERGYDVVVDTQGLTFGAHRANRPGPPPRLRRRQHPGARRVRALRCAASRCAWPACHRAQPCPDRPCARLFTRSCHRFRTLARWPASRTSANALRHFSSCDCAKRKGMAGGILARTRPRAGAARCSAGPAVGNRAEHERSERLAAALDGAVSRPAATRPVGAPDCERIVRPSEWTPACCTSRLRWACRWWRSSPPVSRAHRPDRPRTDRAGRRQGRAAVGRGCDGIAVNCDLAAMRAA